MKIAIAIAVFIGSSAFGAPTQDLLRTRKSAPYGGVQPYGSPSYGPPCSGAPLAPIALYLAPQSAPHYREEDLHGETSEHARTYEAPSYGAASILAPSPSGAVGYFPHANVGSCGVPLLLSCAPNVVAGHLAHAHSYAAPSYKQSGNQEETTELRENAEKSWSDAERASHPGHHHHLIANENDEVAEHKKDIPV